MKCPYCYQEIEDGSTICQICGKELTPENTAEETAGAAPAEETAETAFAEGAAEAASSEAAPQAAGETEPASSEAAIPTAGETETASPEAAIPTAEAVTGQTQMAQEQTLSGDGSGDGEKKPGKKKTGLIVGIVIALVVIIAAAVAIFAPKKNDKEVVIGAFKSIGEPAKTSPMEEMTGWGEIAKKRNSSSTTAQLAVKLEGSSDPSLNAMKSGQLSVSMSNDLTNKKESAVISLGYGGMNIANLDLYADDKTVVAALPELSKKAFTLNYADDLEGQIAKSPYFGQLMEDSGVNLKGLEDYFKKSSELVKAQNQLFDVKALWDRYKKGSTAISDLKAAMTVTDTDKKEFTIDGKSQNCNGYKVVIKKDAFIQFLKTSKEFFLQDDSLKKDFIQYMTLMKDMQSSLGEDVYKLAPEQYQASLWKMADQSFDKYLPELEKSMGDLDLTVYVRKDGKMASFDYSTTLAIEDEAIKASGTVNFGGGYSMLANVNGTMNLEDGIGGKINLKFDKTGAYEAGKSLKSGLTASATDPDGNTYSMKLDGSYQKDKGAFELGANFGSDDQNMLTFSAKGAIQNIVKGESADVIIDSMKFEMPDPWDDGTKEYAEFSGSYKLGPLKGTIEAPKGDTFDVLGASEDDWNSVIKEMYGNVFGLVMQLYK